MTVRILITGGSGYIAMQIGKFLSSLGYEVKLASRAQCTSSGFFHIDWNDDQSLFELCAEADIIIHAASLNARESSLAPAKAFELNAVSTTRLLENAVKAGVSRFIYLSTAHVYSSPLRGVVHEDTPVLNNHPYASSHYAAEQSTVYYSSVSALDAIALRLSNVFGIPPHSNHPAWELFVNDLCYQAVFCDRLKINSNSNIVRDFLPMKVLFDSILSLINFPHSFQEISPRRVLNVGSHISLSLYEMACMVQERLGALSGFSVPILHQSLGPTQALNYISLYRPSGTTTDSIRAEINSLLNHCLERKSSGA